METNKLIKTAISNNNINTYNISFNYKEFENLFIGLKESSNEYFKVTKNNFDEVISFLNKFNEKLKYFENIFQSISKQKNSNEIDILIQNFPKSINITSQLKSNAESNVKNLLSFYQDINFYIKEVENKLKQKNININNITSDNLKNYLFEFYINYKFNTN